MLVLHSCSRGIFISDLFMSSSGEVLKGAFVKWTTSTETLKTTKLEDGWVVGGGCWPSTLWWIALNKQNYLVLPDCQVLIPTIIRLEAPRATELTSSRGGQPPGLLTLSPLCGHKQLTVFKWRRLACLCTRHLEVGQCSSPLLQILCSTSVSMKLAFKNLSSVFETFQLLSPPSCGVEELQGVPPWPPLPPPEKTWSMI